MKYEEFNTLKLVHDNIPKISFIIARYCYEAEKELLFITSVENTDSLSLSDIREIVDSNLVKENDIKYVNYSNIVREESIRYILKNDESIYSYDYIVINMKK